MKTISIAEAREIDRRAQEECDIPEAELMEKAGVATAELACELLGDKTNAKILVVCGGGNNGGDGLVCAQYLTDKGYKVKTEKLKELDIDSLGKNYDLIIDAIFGIGLNTPVKDQAGKVIDKINSLGSKTLAIDVPSGINADTGEVMGVAVYASHTITFGLAKKGLFLAEGPKYSGEVIVKNIFPEKLLS